MSSDNSAKGWQQQQLHRDPLGAADVVPQLGAVPETNCRAPWLDKRTAQCSPAGGREGRERAAVSERASAVADARVLWESFRSQERLLWLHTQYCGSQEALCRGSEMRPLWLFVPNCFWFSRGPVGRHGATQDAPLSTWSPLARAAGCPPQGHATTGARHGRGTPRQGHAATGRPVGQMPP